jgi:hypothetical protein
MLPEQKKNSGFFCCLIPVDFTQIVHNKAFNLGREKTVCSYYLIVDNQQPRPLYKHESYHKG